jgi:uncharacterized protein (TIGR00369 family)
MTAPPNGFLFEPSPDHPGWSTWNLTDPTRFNAQTMGGMLVRVEDQADGSRRIRLRMHPERRHSNLLDAVHGGVTLALIDIALFAGMRLISGGDAAGSVTLDLSTQFIGAGRIGTPLDAVVEVLRETRRLVFVRGLIEQGDDLVSCVRIPNRLQPQRDWMRCNRNSKPLQLRQALLADCWDASLRHRHAGSICGAVSGVANRC